MIERRDNALWIDLEVFGFELLVLEEIDILSLVSEALFGQGDEDLLGADGIEVAIHLEHEKLPRRTDHYPLQCAVRKSYLKNGDL